MAYRDNYNFTDTQPVWVEKYYLSSGGHISSGYTPAYSNQITRSYRDEATSTTPVGGQYVDPTTYRAFFFHTHSSGGTYEGQNGTRYFKKYSGNASTSRAAGSYPWYGCNSGFPYDPAVPYSLVQKAEASALEQMSNGAYDWGQTLAEARTTSAFVLYSTVRLLKAVVAFKRGNLRLAASHLSVKKIPKAVAGGYLATSYGWLPLMSDIHAGVDYISNGLIPNARPRIRVHKLDEAFAEAAKSYKGVNSAYNGWSEGRFKRGVEIGLDFKVKNQLLYDLDRYGLTDPLTMAWQLVPLSFVLDWATGVIDFLKALSPPMGVSFASGYRTLFLDNNYGITYSFDPSDREPSSGSWPTLHVNCKSSVRTTYFTWPVPTPYIDFDMGLSLGQATSLVALAVALV